MTQTGSFKLVRPLWRFALVLGAVAVLTTIDFRLLQVNSATAAFTYFLLILILATRVGLRESIIASIACTLAYNLFFLPPIGTLTIADPQNWVALCAFLTTAMIASHLASSAREKTKEAGARQQELQRMYNFSRALILGDRDRTLLSHATQQIAELFELEGVWLYQGATDSICKAVTDESVLRDSLLRDVASSGVVWRDKFGSALIIPIQLGGHSLGSLGVTGAERLSEVALQSIAQLIAIAWERERAQETANRLEAARQNEQLKSILLDAVAHEFKTPLTSTKAAVTTLLSRRLSERECGFLKIIDEETDRLTNLVSDAIELARIGSGPVILQREVFAVEDIIHSALSEVRALFEGWTPEVRIGKNLPPVYIDRKLTELALRQILDNAWKYAPAGSAIQISADLHSEQTSILLRVANEGPGIPKAEQPLLFEKFYRGKEVRNRIAGTGMGLNISREIIQAHGGRIWVESENGKGTQFFMTIPIAEPETQPVEEKRSSVA